MSLQGNSGVQLAGHIVKVGDKAPKIKVITSDLKEHYVGGKKDKTEVIVTVPSLDTPVCSMEARTFNDRVSKLKNVELTVISMDLPFASKRYCAAHGIKNIIIASDFQEKKFAKAYGVLLDTSILKGILARTIFIVKDGVVTYKQIVPEISQHPNYDEVFKHIK
ncbi:thiol peroxidase [Sulfurimonas sp.]